MKLWGGRFTKETDKLVYNFNASISFDQKFFRQDIQGSIAHATMLGAQGIISKDDSEKIVEGLKSILEDIESGKLEITDEYEDIHTLMYENPLHIINNEEVDPIEGKTSFFKKIFKKRSAFGFGC